MNVLQKAEFVISAKNLVHLPAAIGCEVAFAGRSNAGKSSAINTLTQQHRLAYVSKMPGRTQLINFFRVAEDRYLVDLPGYGYADVPLALKQDWQEVLAAYLATRNSLVGLILIMDIRHPLGVLDRQLLDWFWPTGKSVHVLLTKADKLSRNESKLTLARVSGLLKASYPGHTIQLFSSLKKQGIDEAQALLHDWLGLRNSDENVIDTNKKPPAKGE